MQSLGHIGFFCPQYTLLALTPTLLTSLSCCLVSRSSTLDEQMRTACEPKMLNQCGTDRCAKRSSIVMSAAQELALLRHENTLYCAGGRSNVER